MRDEICLRGVDFKPNETAIAAARHCRTLIPVPNKAMTSVDLISVETRTREALETVYRQFEAPTPIVIEGCPCCIAKRGVDVLVTTPLRMLTGQSLWQYVSGVFYTIGSVRDFRYFLPRILEIAIFDPGNSNNTEIVLGKLRLAEWASWSLADRDSIINLIDAWFDHALSQDLLAGVEWQVGWEAESVLCGAARADLSLSRWLARLRDPAAASVLTDLKDRFPKQLSDFWKDAPVGFNELSVMLAE